MKGIGRGLLWVVVFGLFVGAGYWLWSTSRCVVTPMGNNISTTGWKTFTDTTQKLTFLYPETLGTQYVATQNWPPVIKLSSDIYDCTGVSQADGDQIYCVVAQTQGAAGSIYTDYTYTTASQGKLLTAQFTLRYPQCGNYDAAGKTACEQERADFEISDIAYQIVDSIQFQ